MPSEQRGAERIDERTREADELFASSHKTGDCDQRPQDSDNEG